MFWGCSKPSPQAYCLCFLLLMFFIVNVFFYWVLKFCFIFRNCYRCHLYVFMAWKKWLNTEILSNKVEKNQIEKVRIFLPYLLIYIYIYTLGMGCDEKQNFLNLDFILAFFHETSFDGIDPSLSIWCWNMWKPIIT